MKTQLETDYLVVGCGAAGMAFVDALIAHSNADVVMIDRRHAPGGHWHDAYPFVRLHQPSAYYGVNSLPLGTETLQVRGRHRGFYEQASGPEICAYYDRVMREQLLPSGRVRYFPRCDQVAPRRFVSRLTGDEYEVTVRQRVVDARYLEPSVPKTSPPPFEVAAEARCVPVGELVNLADAADPYVVIGAGKTATDACLWLLQHGVAPDRIRWIKPREAWFLNLAFSQGGELVDTMLEGLTRQVEAAARATSLQDLFVRLEASEQLLRVDTSVVPTMFRGPTMSAADIEDLRRIEDVVRLGHVRRIDRDSIVLEEGTVPTSRHAVHVHCAAIGLNPAPSTPMFTDEGSPSNPSAWGWFPSTPPWSATSKRRGRICTTRTASVRPTAFRTLPWTGCAGR